MVVAVAFGWLLLIVHALFFAIWLPVAAGGSLGLELWVVVWFAGFALVLLVLGRGVRREARELEWMAEEMEDLEPSEENRGSSRR